MSKTVWKFTLQWDTVLDLPEGARVLRVNEQEGCVCLWALVDPQAPLEARHFVAFGTGHPIPDNLPLVFFGTVFLPGGLVIHVFEVVKGA